MIQNFNFNMEDLYLFYHVVDKGGFLKAAEALNMCQARVSRRIARLEETFGAILLYRDMRNIRLTETGKIVFETAKNTLEMMAQTRTDVQSRHKNMSGPITLSATAGFVGFWLLSALKQFLIDYPEIKIDMKNNDFGNANVMMGDADIAIASSRPEVRESLICEVLCEYPFHLYASKEYLKERGIPKKVQDLDHHDIISVKESLPGHLSKDFFTTPLRIGREPGNFRKPHITLDHDLNFIMAVIKGYGIGFLPSFFVTEFPNVQRIILDDHQETLKGCIHGKYLVYSKLLKQSSRHQKLISFIKDQAKELYKTTLI